MSLSLYSWARAPKRTKKNVGMREPKTSPPNENTILASKLRLSALLNLFFFSINRLTVCVVFIRAFAWRQNTTQFSRQHDDFLAFFLLSYGKGGNYTEITNGISVAKCFFDLNFLNFDETGEITNPQFDNTKRTLREIQRSRVAAVDSLEAPTELNAEQRGPLLFMDAASM